MKSKVLIGLAAVLFLTIGIVQAGNQTIVNQNLSKRPYQELPTEINANKADSRADNWEGATLVKEVDKEQATKQKSGPSKYQQLRIRMLGQRPYMEKSTD